MILLLAACMPDDVSGDVFDSGESLDTGVAIDTDTAVEPGGLPGSWISAGDDRSELFAPYFDELGASFSADGAYTAYAVDTEGGRTAFSGTWASGEGSPSPITLTQAVPSQATSKGIYEVDGDTLLYEVAIVEPDYGYVPPTPESGFGTTSGPQISAGMNVQTYRRVE